MAALGADIITFSLLGVHPYGTAMWAGVASGDVKQFGGGTLLAALALVWVSLLISVALWVASGRFGLGERSARLAHVLPRRMALYFVIGTIAFVALDQPDEERVVPREALPYYALWLGLGNRYPDARPAFAALPAPPPPVFTRRPDIVMVLVESLRSDAMTPEVMPYLSQLAARPGCAAGERHYAGGHHLRSTDRSHCWTKEMRLAGLFSHFAKAAAFIGCRLRRCAPPDIASMRTTGQVLLGYAIAPVVPAQFDRYETLLTRDSLVVKGIIGSLQCARHIVAVPYSHFSTRRTGFTATRPRWNAFRSPARESIASQAW